MRKLMCFLAVTVAILFIVLNSFAADGKQLNLSKHENDVIDNSKFITFKDEEGNPKLFKTLALLKFDEGKVKFEIGDFNPVYKKQTNITDYRKYLE